MVNHGIPEPGFNWFQVDLFYCKFCRSQVRVKWTEFKGPELEVKCPSCNNVDTYLRSSVDPLVDSPRHMRDDGYRWLFAVPHPGFARSDVVFCSECNHPTIIPFLNYAAPVEEFHCPNCKSVYKLVMSETGRNFRGFKFNRDQTQ